ELIEKMSKINRYHVQLFSQYLAKLRATPDGDGSLLDHMTILYGAGISNSNRHSGDNLPLMLVGGGAGKLKGGRHLTYTGKPIMANLLATLMDKMDVPVERIWRHAAVDGQPERKRGHGAEAARSRGESQRGAPEGRDAGNGGRSLGLSRHRRTTAR